MPIIDQPTITLNDGNVMPQIGLGVWKAKDGHEVENAVRSAIATGYRLIDTAAVYQNESGVGAGIRSSGISRQELFVTTKLWNSDQGSKNVRPALEASLEKLGLDYIDLYLIHWPTPERGLFLETWLEFEALKNQGLIKSIGVSNFEPAHLDEIAKRSSTIPAVNQIELHPHFQQLDLREYCQKNGIAVESWSPIGGSHGGLLKSDTLRIIASKYGKTPAQVVIRWHLESGLIVIPKSVHEDRIKENFDIFNFELDDEDMQLINGLDTNSRIGPNPNTMNSA